MKYIVKRTNTLVWDDIPKAEIASYTWGNEYTPKAYAQLAMVNGKGFVLKMTAFEEAPLTRYTQYGEPVYTDSCLEFFVSFNPNSPLYMNFEMNSAGAFLSAIRTDRKNKTPIDKIVTRLPNVISEKKDGVWYVEVEFSFEFIEELFGNCAFGNGYVFKGNFYKCGDETEIPHFGSWSPINWEKPDFHRPEFFGSFIIN